MPPKKGGKGKDEPAGLTDKELLLRAENELVALMQLLEARTNEVRSAPGWHCASEAGVNLRYLGIPVLACWRG